MVGLAELAELATDAKRIADFIEASGTVAGCLGTGLRYLKQFVPRSLPWPGKREVETVGVNNIEAFRKRLIKGKPDRKPWRVTVEGTFFRAALLSSGWWERNHEAKIPNFRWQNGLQEWLYRGFEEWAPSWDFNPLEDVDDKTMPYGHFYKSCGRVRGC